MSALMEFFLRNEDSAPYYIPISVSQLTIGRVVQRVVNDDGSKRLVDSYGHIIGFARNSVGERILEVKWEDGSKETVHSTNVSFCF